MEMPVEVALLTWMDVTGTRPTLSMLHDRLAPFQLGTVLILLAQIAAIRQTWRNDPACEQDHQLINELLPKYRARINAIKTPNHIVFSRIGILYVAKQACTACQAAVGISEPTPEEIEQILTCCVIAHDLFIERQSLTTDRTMEKAAMFLPLANYMPHDTFPRDLARNLILLEQIAPTLQHCKNYIDLTTTFATAAGVPPREFMELAYAASIPHITAKREPQEPFILHPDYLAHTSIAPAHIAAFFQKSSITAQELCDQSQNHTLGADFLGFQRTPLVEVHPGAFVAPDPGFLIDKAGASLYWTFHDATAPGDRQALLTYWSLLFEQYVHWLCRMTYQGCGTVHTSPRFANGDEVCDLITAEGSSLIMIEAKASVLTVAAKYGFTPSTLERELHRKAVTGEHGERKGVAQLHYNLTRWLDGADITGIDRTRIKTVYPILLFLDHAFTGPYLHELYNEHFDRRALQGMSKRTIAPLVGLTINDLENCLPYTHEHPLADILDSHYHYAKRRAPQHRQFRVPLLDGKQAGKDLVREELNKFGNALQQRRSPQAPPAD